MSSSKGRLIGGWRAEEFARVHGRSPAATPSAMPGMPWSSDVQSRAQLPEEGEQGHVRRPGQESTSGPNKPALQRSQSVIRDSEDRATEAAMQERIEIRARLRAKMMDQHRRELAAEAAGPCKADREAAFLIPDGSPWERHELAWRFFEQANPPSVAYNDIPWPPSKDVMSGMMQMLGAQGDAAGKTAHRVLTLRWHPDKFLARWGPRVVDADEKAKIMAAINRITTTVRKQYDDLKKLVNG